MVYKRKTFYSYSRLWSYIRDPQQYYRNYILKMKDPPSAPMILGRIFSDAYAGLTEINDKNFTFQEAIINPKRFYPDTPDDIFFKPDKVRIMKTAFEDKNLYRLPPKFCEQSVFAESKICPLMAKHDGRIKKDDKVLIVENKFGNPWNEERANSEDQITFYSYVDYLLTGLIPKIRVQSVNTNTGKVLVFEVKKTKEQFTPLEEKIDFAYQGIIAERWEKNE